MLKIYNSEEGSERTKEAIDTTEIGSQGKTQGNKIIE